VRYEAHAVGRPLGTAARCRPARRDRSPSGLCVNGRGTEGSWFSHPVAPLPMLGRREGIGLLWSQPWSRIDRDRPGRPGSGPQKVATERRLGAQTALGADRSERTRTRHLGVQVPSASALGQRPQGLLRSGTQNSAGERIARTRRLLGGFLWAVSAHKTYVLLLSSNCLQAVTCGNE
jgi:hypothetical protein